jgi:multiple sugar transport system permease protein
MTAAAPALARPDSLAVWRGWRGRPRVVIVTTLLLLGGIVMVMPILFMLATSFKTGAEIYDLRLIPRDPTLENYVALFQNRRFLDWFVNSLVIATVSTISVVFFDGLVGYTLCKFRFRGRGLVFVAILSTLMIPTEMLVIPWYLMARQLGWLNSWWGIMFPGMISAFGVFLLRQFFESVPDDFIDAARIDGLNEFAIWWHVAMPLVAPALSALAIFNFLGNWTAFLWPLIAVSDGKMFTVPVGLASFAGEYTTEWQVIMTGASVATIPTLLVFILFQRFIVRGVMLSGLKG